MANIYYGKGQCYIESGQDIQGVEINYIGSIEVEDQSPENYELFINDKKILIFGIAPNKYLDTLFNYTGDLTINSVIVSNKAGEKVTSRINSLNDAIKNSNITINLDVTTPIKDKIATTLHKKRIRKSTDLNPIIKNQSTDKYDGNLYDINGNKYEGSFHIHKYTGIAMTGEEHTKGSKELYFTNKNTLKKRKTGSRIIKRNI
jgi:hypothetical protein